MEKNSLFLLRGIVIGGAVFVRKVQTFISPEVYNLLVPPFQLSVIVLKLIGSLSNNSLDGTLTLLSLLVAAITK